MAKGHFHMIARRTALLVLAAMVVALAPQAQAAWPEKPIKFVLPFGAGGVADVTAPHSGRQTQHEVQPARRGREYAGARRDRCGARGDHGAT